MYIQILTCFSLIWNYFCKVFLTIALDNWWVNCCSHVWNIFQDYAKCSSTLFVKKINFKSIISRFNYYLLEILVFNNKKNNSNPSVYEICLTIQMLVLRTPHSKFFTFKYTSLKLYTYFSVQIVNKIESRNSIYCYYINDLITLVFSLPMWDDLNFINIAFGTSFVHGKLLSERKCFCYAKSFDYKDWLSVFIWLLCEVLMTTQIVFTMYIMNWMFFHHNHDVGRIFPILTTYYNM